LAWLHLSLQSKTYPYPRELSSLFSLLGSLSQSHFSGNRVRYAFGTRPTNVQWWARCARSGRMTRSTGGGCGRGVGLGERGPHPMSWRR
jgi:hypothetical protein